VRPNEVKFCPYTLRVMKNHSAQIIYFLTIMYNLTKHCVIYLDHSTMKIYNNSMPNNQDQDDSISL